MIATPIGFEWQLYLDVAPITPPSSPEELPQQVAATAPAELQPESPLHISDSEVPITPEAPDGLD